MLKAAGKGTGTASSEDRPSIVQRRAQNPTFLCQTFAWQRVIADCLHVAPCSRNLFRAISCGQMNAMGCSGHPDITALGKQIS